MKRVEVRGAAPVRDGIVEPVEIVVSGSFPDRYIKRIEDLGRGFEEDAQRLFDALSRTLPKGTLIRLLGLMLNHEAQSCYLVIPHPQAEGRPIDMLLFCPCCGKQHIDEARPDICETCGQVIAECLCAIFTEWLNPPHKSHRCNFCNYVWRPADVPTNGVAAIQTKGQRDRDPSGRSLDKVEPKGATNANPV